MKYVITHCDQYFNFTYLICTNLDQTKYIAINKANDLINITFLINLDEVTSKYDVELLNLSYFKNITINSTYSSNENSIPSVSIIKCNNLYI